MTHNVNPAPRYPKTHLLIAGGVAAFLSLALLVFPASDVEAKKTLINLDLGTDAERIIQEKDDLRPPSVTGDNGATPFPQADASSKKNSAGQDANNNENPSPNSQTPTDPSQRIITVGKGDTLSTVFSRAGLDNQLLHALLASSKDARQLTRLKIGQQLEFKLGPDGQFEHVRSKLSELESIQLSKSDKGFTFKRDRIEPEVRQAYARGVIDSSLFVATKRAGMSHALAMDMANIFGYDIDFALDLRDGDSFEVLYEEKVVKDLRVGNGAILAARFINRGKTYTAIRYTNKQGVSSYYTADGDSMRKAFIRTPVDFARISSRFSTGRRHPILNKIRAHKGVDYAAPRGTPIKAAGDGRVLLAGRKGGYGNAVVIQHGNRYRTLYGHMHGFAKGIRNGVSVRQGQIIGYIGTTGLSTGPHLHYEFQVNGVHVDPLSQKQLMADPIARNEKQRFLQLSKPLLAQLDKEKASMLAMNKR